MDGLGEANAPLPKLGVLASLGLNPSLYNVRGLVVTVGMDCMTAMGFESVRISSAPSLSVIPDIAKPLDGSVTPRKLYVGYTCAKLVPSYSALSKRQANEGTHAH